MRGLLKAHQTLDVPSEKRRTSNFVHTRLYTTVHASTLHDILGDIQVCWGSIQIILPVQTLIYIYGTLYTRNTIKAYELWDKLYTSV